MRDYLLAVFGVCVMLSLLAGAGLAAAQNFQPPPPKKVDDQTMDEIVAKKKKLGGLIQSLRKQGLGDPWLSDVEVYHRAATMILEHNEFYTAQFAQWTLEALDRGLLRARLAAAGETPWVNVGGYSVIRSYRSRIDGSVQPFAVTLPANYVADPKKKWRIDVVLHGRDTTLNEVKFLHEHNGDNEAPAADFVQIDIFGRGNNAYRWAGEVDVLEALQAFQAVETKLGRRQLLDTQRLLLRGFSMGGAGTWHLGLHMPDLWCVIGPGAGFTATHGYVKGLPAKLPEWQEKCLTIYDAVDYAENVFDVPVVAYAGADDDQLQAAKNIEQRLKGLPFADRLQLLVAPGTKHSFPAAWRQKAEKEYAKFAAKGRPEYPDRVRFVTYTLKYHNCDWVEILDLDHHYHKALVDAEITKEGYRIKTENVQALHITLPGESADKLPDKLVVDIDQQQLAVRPLVSRNLSANLYLRKYKNAWKAVLPQKLLTERAQQPRKTTGVQGPIDDAFTDSFVCVRGSGKGWHDATDNFAEGQLERFKQEWSKFWRGDLPVKDDREIEASDPDIASRNLILFGDPSSNNMIAHVLDGLPLTWDKEKIVFAGKVYKSAEHVPVLIFPNPLNPQRYVVLNSGHTFHAADYTGTNALLYPRLGDYAVLRLKGTKEDPLRHEVATAGLFDDNWRPAAKAKEQ